MIVFRLIKESLVCLGIRSPKSFKKVHRFTLKNSMIFICFIASTTLMSLFFILEDGTVAEYSTATFGLLCSVVGTIVISTLIWKTEKLYKFIDEFEDIVQEREYLRWFEWVTETTNYWATLVNIHANLKGTTLFLASRFVSHWKRSVDVEKGARSSSN